MFSDFCRYLDSILNHCPALYIHTYIRVHSLPLVLRIYNLSKSARDEVFERASQVLSNATFKSKDLKIAESDDGTLAIIFDSNVGLYLGRRNDSKEFLFPLLKDEVILPKLPTVTVDIGAIKFVCNGANIMRPGIIKVEGDFTKSSLVLVREQKYSKAIAVGRSLLSRAELESAAKGSVVENLHYVGDRFWEALKEVAESKA